MGSRASCRGGGVLPPMYAPWRKARLGLSPLLLLLLHWPLTEAARRSGVLGRVSARAARPGLAVMGGAARGGVSKDSAAGAPLGTASNASVGVMATLPGGEGSTPVA